MHNVEYSESEPVLLIVKNVESEVQNFTVRLIDEITSRQLLSQTVPSGQYTLPQIITENPGTYRVIVETESQSGEMVFSVRAGTLDHVRLLPASSSLIRGGETVVMLSLEDRYGHTIAPNLHHVKLTIE